MNIIVVGCGRVGSDLANRLFLAGHRVSIVDRDPLSFRNLPSDFTGRLHEGDALSQDVLVRAGIEHADALAAVTNSDPMNAVVGHVAKVEYSIPIVVARNYDPHFRSLFEEFNLQVVSSASWGAQRIEELLYSETMHTCLLYTSDAADDLLCVDLGGRRIIKKKNSIILTILHSTTYL